MKDKDINEQEYLNHSKLEERRKFAIADVSGRNNEIVFEVNWNSLVKKKGLIKLTINDEIVVVDRDQLWSILFILGSSKEQEELVSPFIKRTIVTKYFKMIGVTATKDIKKGETLNIPLEFTYNPENHQIIIGKGSVSEIEKRLKA